MLNLTIKLLLLGGLLRSGQGYYSRILDKADNVLYLYPKHRESIAEVDWCGEREPCAVVSKRYWLPQMVVRPCRCRNLPCNSQYSQDSNNPNTVQLDNRSQFKMCESGEEDEAPMKRCEYGAREIGVTVEETRTPNTEGTTDSRLLESKVSVKCRCQHGYWQLSRHTLDRANNTIEIHNNQYHCNRLTRCKRNDFCGHIRADTHSAYYRCSCPKGTLCISTDKSLRNASELLYEGPMYRAYCQPLPQ